MTNINQFLSLIIVIVVVFPRESNRYSELQNDLEDIYTNMQEFCLKEEFRRHVKTDGYDLENIDEKLRIWREDVVKTECPIVIAGQ